MAHMIQDGSRSSPEPHHLRKPARTTCCNDRFRSIVVDQGVKIQYTFAATGRSVSFTEVMLSPAVLNPAVLKPGAMLNRARYSTGRNRVRRQPWTEDSSASC